LGVCFLRWLSLSCLFSKSLFLFLGLAFLLAGTGARGTRLTLCVVISSLWVAGVFWWRVFFFSPSCCFRLRGIFEYFSVSFGSFYYKNLRIIVASTISLSASLSFSLLQSLRDSSVSACDDASPRKSSTTGAFFSFAGGRAMTCCILPILISQF
jgi:hypothetical protein